MRENFTNEELFEKFTSPFTLVNRAIELAHIIVERGEEHTNLANDVLEMISNGEDELPENAPASLPA